MFKKEIDKLKELLKKYDKIIILRHQNPDFDALGSQLGLFNLLKETYPTKEIYAHGSDDISSFSFLGENVELKDNDFKDSLVIITDTANVDRIEGNYNLLQKQNNFIVKIDHHPHLEVYGDLNIVDDKKSSTSELIYDLFVKGLNCKLNVNSARTIFTGIFGDTGGFSYPSTTSHTFLVVSELVKQNFNYEDLILTIKELEDESVRVLGWMYENVKIENGLGIIKFDKKTLNELEFNKKKISMLVGNLGVFKSLKAWLLMVEHDTFIRVNLRSKKDINVSKIAQNFNGGGHKNASGARIKTWQEAEELIKEVQKVL